MHDFVMIAAAAGDRPGPNLHPGRGGRRFAWTCVFLGAFSQVSRSNPLKVTKCCLQIFSGSFFCVTLTGSQIGPNPCRTGKVTGHDLPICRPAPTSKEPECDDDGASSRPC